MGAVRESNWQGPSQFVPAQVRVLANSLPTKLTTYQLIIVQLSKVSLTTFLIMAYVELSPGEIIISLMNESMNVS